MSDIDNDLLNVILQNQRDLQAKLEVLEQKIANIEEELYLEEDDDFEIEIECPYCGTEISVDFDESREEVTCPECENVIELDWTGDLEEHDCSHGGCSACSGCGSHSEENEDDM